MRDPSPNPVPARDLAETIRLVERHLEGLRESGVRRLVPDSRPAGGAVRLAEIARRIETCRRCPLHRSRTRTVPGQGRPDPEILFIGEGPGREEDAQGLAFVGRAGELLTRLIRRMGLEREDVFIANVVKCRPTEGGQGAKDRPPDSAESGACLPFLREQIEALRPRVIVTLGNIPLEALTGRRGITKLRGRWLSLGSIDLMPTYHPSYLLRAGGEDKSRWWEVWDDMREVLRRLGRPVPPGPARKPARDAGS